MRSTVCRSMTSSWRSGSTRSLRPAPALPEKRHRQDRSEGHVARIVKRGHADRDRLVRHVEHERAMQIIPPRQKARPVAVRLAEAVGVMDAVHARRDDETHEPPLDRARQLDVSVMEEDRREEDQLPDPNGVRRGAEDRDLRGAVERRDGVLAEVKAERRRRVEIVVDVMDEVKSPEESDAMTREVPPPERVVEE